MSLKVGQMLYGYCRGVFGRDSYGDKRIEAIGFDWIVVREEKGYPNFANGLDNLKLLETEDCTKPPKEEDL